MSEPSAFWRRTVLQAIIVGCLLVVVLTTVAMAFFSGGTVTDRSTHSGPMPRRPISIDSEIRRWYTSGHETTWRRCMLDRIIVDPGIHFGKPTIKGTRITVQNVLELLNEGASFDEITTEYYPELTVDDIRACIRYAIALVSSEDINLAAA